MMKRLEGFKDYAEQIRLQDIIIYSKKSEVVDVCEAGLHETAQALLMKEVEEAENEKSRLVEAQVKEKKELEELLQQYLPDNRIRTIFILHYLQGMTLKDVASQIGLSYFYIRELASNGREMISQAVQG